MNNWTRSLLLILLLPFAGFSQVKTVQEYIDQVTALTSHRTSKRLTTTSTQQGKHSARMDCDYRNKCAFRPRTTTRKVHRGKFCAAINSMKCATTQRQLDSLCAKARRRARAIVFDAPSTRAFSRACKSSTVRDGKCMRPELATTRATSKRCWPRSAR